MLACRVSPKWAWSRERPNWLKRCQTSPAQFRLAGSPKGRALAGEHAHPQRLRHAKRPCAHAPGGDISTRKHLKGMPAAVAVMLVHLKWLFLGTSLCAAVHRT